VSWPWIALLAAALVVLVGAEWPRVSRLLGSEGRKERERKKRKAKLRVVRDETDVDDFAASVQRDLESLPTIEERDRT
jgi:hypothetical protein